ncbi:MAG: patatin-like phospholipase family protein [Candidatus Omnitrophica bacterium]|nr:patatin-like phospholipase family protein [Candidatus Omnitrophota bacterium]
MLVGILLVSGCAGVRHAVPEETLINSSVFGLRDIRAFSGIPSDSFKKDFIGLLENEQKDARPFFDFNSSRTYSMLAISGGAANGAYGAGLLNGWSESGNRPVFKVVTGISTGAIIAPFAFLGSGYDRQLKEFYTAYSTKDIVRIRSPRIRIPFSNSIASTVPLQRLIEKYIDAKLLEDVASEHGKGRRLYVGTTNLDAGRLVIWDMGKIASAGNKDALMLFRKVILASASVPVAFPPVYLKVEADNNIYDEMHVDGGISKQVFFLYDVLQGLDKALKAKGIDASKIRYEIYVIRNGYIDPFYKEVPDKLFAIAERTVDTMTNAQSIGDLYQLYVFTNNSKGDFNLAYIPATHLSGAKELFDPVEMRELFDLGFKEALDGYPWKKIPPGME